MKLSSFLIMVLMTFQAWGVELAPFPCTPQSVSTEIDISNSDDLFLAGNRLLRAKRFHEAIDCLNRAKDIAPGYLDVRLSLVDAFARLSDKRSAQLELAELERFEMVEYYAELFFLHKRRVAAIVNVIDPHPVYSFRAVLIADRGHHLKKLVEDEKILNFHHLQTAVSLKNLAKFVEAQRVIDHSLKENPLSPTVHFYAALIAYANFNYQSTTELLKRTLELVAIEPDIILVMGRALNNEGAYKESLAILDQSKAIFESYGCYQFGEILYRAHLGLGYRPQVELIHSLLMGSLSNQENPKLCEELKHLI